MLKKLFSILAISIILVLVSINPVQAGERKVLGLNFPFTSGICYEHESADNRSWIISGLIYTDNSFSNRDISLSCYSGIRFYNGDTSGRFYTGLYGTGLVFYVEPGLFNFGLGTMGVWGYEYRFGSNQNIRIFAEGGLAASFSSFDRFKYGPTAEAGLGFNI